MLLQILVLSVSLSIDAFGIGLSFQLKGVKINAVSRFIIGIESVIVMYISFLAGQACMWVFPKTIMKIIGAAVLCLIGITFIKNSLFVEESKYDRNQSKNIEWQEALILGVALSADAFSAGFAFVALQIGNGFIPITVGFMQILFLSLGSLMAERSCLSKKINAKICGVFSGCLLILIAFLKGIC